MIRLGYEMTPRKFVHSSICQELLNAPFNKAQRWLEFPTLATATKSSHKVREWWISLEAINVHADH